jgi:hypothetical protein
MNTNLKQSLDTLGRLFGGPKRKKSTDYYGNRWDKGWKGSHYILRGGFVKTRKEHFCQGFGARFTFMQRKCVGLIPKGSIVMRETVPDLEAPGLAASDEAS